MAQDLKRTNEVKIAGRLDQQQITATFSKQVLKINAKDTKDNQWKEAEIEIYIKPDLLTQSGAAIGDTILLEGWLAFNFWNGRSFPRIVATNVQVLEKAGAQQQSQTQQQFNQPQMVAANSAQAQVAPSNPSNLTAPNGPTIPTIPNVPNIPM